MKLLFLFFSVFFLGQTKITPQYIESELKKIDAVMAKGNTDEYIKANTTILTDSKKIKFSKGIAVSAVNLSNSYLLLGDYKTSLDYLKLAKKEKYTTDNVDIQIHIKRLYSYNCAGIDLFQEAINSLKEIRLLSDELPVDTVRLFIKSGAYNDLGAIYLEKEQFDSATLYMKKAIHTIEDSKITSHKLQRLLIWYYLVLANVKLEERKTDSAEMYVRLAENRPKKLFGNHNFKLYQTKGLIHEQKKEYEAAITDYIKALKLAKKANITATIDLYKRISEVYTNLGNKEASKNYLQQYISLSDSLSNNAKPLIEDSVKEVVTKKEGQLQGKIWIIIYSIGVAIIAGAVFLFFILRKSRKKQIALNQKDQEKKLLNKKLNVSFDKIVQLAKENDTEFLDKFQETYPDFFSKLRNLEPDLTDGELKFCALLFLGFSTKDIADYTDVQPQSVQTRKNRLRKKLNIASSDDIYIWMKDIGNKS